MAPPKKYKTGKSDIHVNIETELKNIGDEFGLVPTVLLTEMYIATINENMSRFGATDEIRERWCKFNAERELERKNALKRERELKKVGEKAGLKKKIQDEEQDKFIHWIYSELFVRFTPEELNHYISAVKSDDEYKVRYAVTSIIKHYNERACSAITLQKEDVVVLINHLIRLGDN